MIKDRYGVVNDEERNEFEKKYQLPFSYKLVTFNYREAEIACRDLGNGYVVDKISTTKEAETVREVIYRAS
jgi:hypothetical protein